ncbi:MAG: bifunctional precorrin-2 dehydrogenase/sirohydrochlorin ferrochelatase [Bryobacterales bacterium]|nr:bifunctional precorrin-2 dehydrogenase/sirohydrochlorin ferrochelatase [Bryobacterales bacterium]
MSHLSFHGSIAQVPYYPLFLDIREKPVVVVGAGRVALRKTLGLLECGARVTVVAPARIEEFARLVVCWKQRRFQRRDLAGAALAFAATDDRRVNHRVAEEAARLGIPVNVADSREECRFLVPARVRREGVTIAISTGGRSPRRAAELRRKIEALLDG